MKNLKPRIHIALIGLLFFMVAKVNAQIPVNITLVQTIINSINLELEVVIKIDKPDGVDYDIEAGNTTTDVTFTAGKEIYLGSGFEVEEGALFYAHIVPIGDNPTYLKDKLDGSFYRVKSGFLRIILEEAYYSDGDVIDLKIYNKSGTEVFSNTTLTKSVGVNTVNVDISSGSFSAGEFYNVEVITKKKSKKYLRFKYE